MNAQLAIPDRPDNTPPEGCCQRCRQTRPLFDWSPAPYPWEIGLPELRVCSPCWSALELENEMDDESEAERRDWLDMLRAFALKSVVAA